jgi:hypothetical protein
MTHSTSRPSLPALAQRLWLLRLARLTLRLARATDGVTIALARLSNQLIKAAEGAVVERQR